MSDHQAAVTRVAMKREKLTDSVKCLDASAGDTCDGEAAPKAKLL